MTVADVHIDATTVHLLRRAGAFDGHAPGLGGDQARRRAGRRRRDADRGGVRATVRDGVTTRDLGGTVSTSSFTVART